MTYKVAVVFFSQHGFLPLFANVIAEGARKVCPTHLLPAQQWLDGFRIGGCVRGHGLQVQGAEVTVYRIKDPVRPDNSEDFDEGVLEAPIVSKQASLPVCLPLEATFSIPEAGKMRGSLRLHTWAGSSEGLHTWAGFSEGPLLHNVDCPSLL
jgi:hypothetical protein